jgi:protein TonB
VVAKLEPVTQPTKPSLANELPELPVGDEPALAMASGKGTGAVAAPPSSPAPAPVRVAPPVVAAHEGANYLKNPRPAYPELAQRRGWEGEVLLRVRVSPDGRPVTISVQMSSGRDLLDTAAVEAVRGWSFVPARLGAEPVAGWVTVPIVFHLQ